MLSLDDYSLTANGIELTGLSDNLIKGKQKLDMKLKRMCSKKHFLKRTGIHAVLEAAKHSGTISGIEKETRCIIKLPHDIDESISVMLSDFEVIEPEITEGNVSVLQLQFFLQNFFSSKKKCLL